MTANEVLTSIDDKDEQFSTFSFYISFVDFKFYILFCGPIKLAIFYMGCLN